jgi:hypothetical protein
MPSWAASAITIPLLTVGLLLSGCSAESGGSARSTHPVTIRITEKDGRIDPSGDTVEVDQGQDITLVVSSDAEDEIHVHSEPEHEFPITGRGVQRITFSIDSPGTYEVESHELDVVIVKLQVS